MMETIQNCPRNGDNCSLCVKLAEEEFGDELRGGGFDESTTLNYIGDAKLQARVNERGGVSALSCEQRRNSARLIGRRAGEALVDRSKAPGDM
jgi:hypothetical protein